MFVLGEEREIGGWRFLKGVTRWWKEMRWVQIELMARAGLEGSRLIDEGVIKVEQMDAVWLRSELLWEEVACWLSAT